MMAITARVQTTDGATHDISVADPVITQTQTKFNTLTDDFTTENTALWDGYASPRISATGGQLRMLGDNAGEKLTTIPVRDLTGSSVTIECPSIGDAGGATATLMQLISSADPTDTLEIGYEGTSMLGRYHVNNVATDNPAGLPVYNPTTNRWWKIGENAGTIYWAVSPDGITWTNIWSVAKPAGINITAMKLRFLAWKSTNATNASIFDNLNLPPTPPSGQLVKNGWYTGTFAPMDPIGVHNHYLVGNGAQWDAYLAGNNPGDYTCTQVMDATKGRNVLRLELRYGDTALNPPAERSQISFQNTSNQYLGETYWHGWSVKFDPSWQVDRGGEQGWFASGGFHPDTSVGHAPISFYALWDPSGYWGIGYSHCDPVTDVETWQGTIWKVPISPGTWHNIKVQMYAGRADGWFKLWYNGVLQTFINSHDGASTGKDTYRGTMIRASTNYIYWQDQAYRGGTNFYQGRNPDIAYFGGYRMATTESAL